MSARRPVRSLSARAPRLEALEDRTVPSFAEFLDPNPAPGNQFGAQVVPLSTGNVVITSPYDDAGGTDAGAVYLFNGATGELISALTGSHDYDRVGDYAGVMPLTNGNFVIVSPTWDNGAVANAGAVTWGSGTTGVSGPISAANSLVGTAASEGLGGTYPRYVTTLPNGNYLVRDPSWNNDRGAVTFGDGATGISGLISASNSLVGNSAGDRVGSEAGIFIGYPNQVRVLPNGNYVVLSKNWDNGTVVDAGAATWGSGTTGVTGVVSAANSLVGSSADDRVGDSMRDLSNGNYVVTSPSWDNGAVTDAGAVTWGSGTTAVVGVVSAANSLVGGSAGDQLGGGGGGVPVYPLTNGNYVVASPGWDNGAVENAGAVTFGDGATGVAGTVSVTNSLVGTSAGDGVGSSVAALTNGNYAVATPYWDNGAVANAGAVTWGDGAGGTVGVVSAANSLVGTTESDTVGSGVTALSNGNYVVVSPSWDDGAAADAGAVTWGDGSSGTVGAVSSLNSLVGATLFDRVGGSGITTLPAGNYVVTSLEWDNGAAVDAGAVTFGDGTAGVHGVVSATNSLVGSTNNDAVGWAGITVLTNGNYVVVSPLWDNGVVVDVGAVTWGSGTTGVAGAVSAGNSLAGSTENDLVGYGTDFQHTGGVTALPNGNYVVVSPVWDNGAAADAGAVTFGDGTAGVSGAVSAINSLVGGTTADKVGYSGITVLPSGNYLVSSSEWDGEAAYDTGAVTWGSGTAGAAGVVSAANSLVGVQDLNTLAVQVLANGNYVVVTDLHHVDGFGNTVYTGAVTWGSGAAGVTGPVSAANSLVGTDFDPVLYVYGVTALSNGNYVVSHGGGSGLADGTAAVTGFIDQPGHLFNPVPRAGYALEDAVNQQYYVGNVYEDNGKVWVGSTVPQPSATHFAVSAPTSVTAGTPFTVTVTALDSANNVVTGYAGSVFLSSTTFSATYLPASATLTNGTGTFTVTITSAGSWTVTAADQADPSLTGSAPVAVSAGPATRFDLFTPLLGATAGTPFNVVVFAADDFGNTATGYTGTVHFTSTDPAAALPADATLTNGAGTFAVTLATVGVRSVTVTDTVAAALTKTATVPVSSGAATLFLVSAPAGVTAGTPFTVTVTALDAAFNTATGYTGTVHFTGGPGATLPADATLTNGVGTFTVALTTAGTFTVTATDTASATITGSSAPVAVAAGAATHFDVNAFFNETAGTPFNVFVTARDAFNNTATGYTGTVHFSSSDPAATLPADAALANGSGTFAVTLRTATSGTISVTDTAAASVTGTTGNVLVNAGAATHFTFFFPATAATGAPVPVLVTARDAFDNVAFGYTGTVHLTSTDAAATLPADAPLAAGTKLFTVTFQTPGTWSVTATDTASASLTGTTAPVVVTAPAAPPPPASPPPPGPVRPVAVGGAADGAVRLTAADGTTTTVSPFGSTGVPTRTAAGDLDGDGVADVVAVTGPGTALRVAVLSGRDGSVLVAPFDPFGGDFTGGGYVAAGDLDGDGRAEFAVTPDQGGGPRVTVFARNADGSTAVRANFLGIDDSNFRGGARAAVGDVNGDGVPDLVVAAGFGGGPRTAIFTGQSVLAGSPARLVGDFFAFPGSDATNLRNGSFVAAGDVTGDGFADLVFGGGPGGAPRVFILSGALVSAGQVGAAQASPVANFFVAGDLNDRGGARVAVTNSDGDGKADLAVGSGAGRPAKVRVYLGKDFAGGGEPPAADLDVLGGAVLADGVYVG